MFLVQVMHLTVVFFTTTQAQPTIMTTRRPTKRQKEQSKHRLYVEREKAAARVLSEKAAKRRENYIYRNMPGLDPPTSDDESEPILPNEDESEPILPSKDKLERIQGSLDQLVLMCNAFGMTPITFDYVEQYYNSRYTGLTSLNEVKELIKKGEIYKLGQSGRAGSYFSTEWDEE